MALPNGKSEITNNFGLSSKLIYGAPKTGKTTFASQFDTDKHKVLFFPTEAGYKFVSTRNWKTDDDKFPSSWPHFLQCLNEFASSDYDELVVDTVGHLLKWCILNTLEKRHVTDESEGNYGDIYRRISREFDRVINKLGQLNKGITFIAHMSPRKEKDGLTYPDLPEKYENLFNGMVDYIFYCGIDKDGNRWIRTKPTDKIIAGDRSGKLPPVIKMEINELMSHFK